MTETRKNNNDNYKGRLQ